MDWTKGTYATTIEDLKVVPSGFAASGRYALPNPAAARYVYVVVPGAGHKIDGGTVRPAHSSPTLSPNVHPRPPGERGRSLGIMRRFNPLRRLLRNCDLTLRVALCAPVAFPVGALAAV